MRTNAELKSERETVLLARQGDREAFRRLVDAYDERLVYFVRRILGDGDATLDVLQNVWLTAYRGLWKLRSPEAFRVWLYRIAHDQAVSELRRRTRRPVPVEDTEATGEHVGDDSHEAAFDNAELVHAALQRLSIDHRRILTLRFLEDMSMREIADVVGCSDGTVKSRLHHARLSLRRHIEEITND